ncbi:glycerol-3-phosphate responsive antiterminator [Nocardia sp. NPDC004278]
MPPLPGELDLWLTRNPVIAAVFGAESVPAFLRSECRVNILAHVALHELAGLVRALSEAGRFTFVNADACSGLGQDRGAVEYLQSIGAPGVVSTKGALIQRTTAAGMVTMQKVFVTDRSNLPRAINSVRQNRPHLVQAMPWPVLSHLRPPEIEGLSPFVAAGFVRSTADVSTALREGARAVSTSAESLWDAAGR